MGDLLYINMLLFLSCFLDASLSHFQSHFGGFGDLRNFLENIFLNVLLIPSGRGHLRPSFENRYEKQKVICHLVSQNSSKYIRTISFHGYIAVLTCTSQQSNQRFH